MKNGEILRDLLKDRDNDKSAKVRVAEIDRKNGKIVKTYSSPIASLMAGGITLGAIDPSGMISVAGGIKVVALVVIGLRAISVVAINLKTNKTFVIKPIVDAAISACFVFITDALIYQVISLVSNAPDLVKNISQFGRASI